MVRVVVLGGGFAGARCARDTEAALKDADVTLVEARDASVNKFAGARGSVYGKNFSHRMAIPNDTVLKRGKVVHSEIIAVSSKSVTLSDSSELEFDYLVCATGARNNFGEPPLATTKLDDIKAYYERTADAIAKASKILIVGGGPVGVELAGEILDRYPSGKKISIVNAGQTLITNDPPFRDALTGKLKKQLEKKDVDVYLGAKAEGLDFSSGEPFVAGEQNVKLTSGETVECDLVLLAIGTTLSTSIYPEEWLNEKKLLKTNEFLQLVDHPNIFAIGDCNDQKETKMGALAMGQGTSAAKNIAKLAKSGDSARLKKYSTQNGIMLVPIGRKGGRAQLGPVSVGSFAVSKIKGGNVFAPMAWGLYNQKKNLKPEIKEK